MLLKEPLKVVLEDFLLLKAFVVYRAGFLLVIAAVLGLEEVNTYMDLKSKVGRE